LWAPRLPESPNAEAARVIETGLTHRRPRRPAAGPHPFRRFAAGVALLVAASMSAEAQELEPRAYRTLPTGYNFALISYGYSTGNVVADATSSVQDLSLDASIVGFGYLRSMGIAGRSSSVAVQLPYVFLGGTAKLDGAPVSGTRTGLADARVRLAVNLLGGPALAPAEFAQYRQRRNLGVSLTVSVPVGEYNSAQQVNLGTNRWGLKPEVGYSSIKGRWILDAAIGVWIFTNNNDFFDGNTLSQDPIPNVQAHVSYNFNHRVWLAADGNWFSGGRTEVNGAEVTAIQNNSRVGLTLSVAVARGQSLKFAAQTGAYTRAGAQFDGVSIAYQFGWGSGLR
jgi:hypothetical protein